MLHRRYSSEAPFGLVWSICTQAISYGATEMRKLLLSSALVAGLCVPALAGNNQGQNNNNQGQNNNNQGGGGHTHGAPGPVAGEGLPVIALVGLGGLGVYWLVRRRRRQI
jgi:MYXO-CTERM domain-containing protein